MEQLRQVVGCWLEMALTPVAAGLHRFGVSAAQVSIGGLLLNVVTAGLIVADQLIAAGILYLIAATLDLLDGVLARSSGTPTRFGAFLDSFLDRVSEGVVFAAIGYRFALDETAIDASAAVLALLGSFLVSYTRARAEGLGAECKVGIATRAERIVLVAIGLVAGLLTQAVYLVLFLTTITVMQRVLHVRRELRTKRRGQQLYRCAIEVQNSADLAEFGIHLVEKFEGRHHAAKGHEPQKIYSPYVQRTATDANFAEGVYWGDTHLHTPLWTDAGRGQTLTLVAQERASSQGPVLDEGVEKVLLQYCLAREHGFRVLERRRVELRKERGVGVPGDLYLLERADEPYSQT